MKDRVLVSDERLGAIAKEGYEKSIKREQKRSWKDTPPEVKDAWSAAANAVILFYQCGIVAPRRYKAIMGIEPRADGYDEE